MAAALRLHQSQQRRRGLLIRHSWDIAVKTFYFRKQLRIASAAHGANMTAAATLTKKSDSALGTTKHSSSSKAHTRYTAAVIIFLSVTTEKNRCLYCYNLYLQLTKLTILSDDPPDHLSVDVHVAPHEPLATLNAVAPPHQRSFADQLSPEGALQDAPRPHSVHWSNESPIVNQVAGNRHRVRVHLAS